MRRPVLAAVLVVAAAGCTTFSGSGSRATEDMGTAATPSAAADVDVATCRWGLGDDVSLPDRLSEDGLALAGQPPVDLDEATDWSDPPHDHATWRFELHTLRWTYPLVAAAADGDREARDTLDKVLRSWLAANGDPDSAAVEEAWHGHPVALRTQVATCAAHVLGLDTAREVLEGGVAWLRQEENFDGIWNHGIDQSLSLLMAGCTIGDEEAVDVAVRRLDRHRTEGVDEQGVTNEQATKYQQYVRDQYGTVIAGLEACGRDADRFRRAHAAMLPMIVHATRPDGSLAPVGDTPLGTPGVAPGQHPDAGPHGEAPARTTAIYARGYAFGRDHWGPDATWFGLRFGEGRIIHGHRDHTSLLYDVLGRPVLTEAAFSGYQSGPWRDWERSHAAHNVVTVSDGGRFLWDHETPLVHEEVGDDHVSLTVAARPYEAVEEHRRAVLVSFAPHAVVVRDVLTSPAPVDSQQLWHLPAGWEVATDRDGASTGTGPDGVGLRVLQLTDDGRTTVVTGQEEPIQAFVGTGQDTREPAPVLVHEATGTRVIRLTVLVPTGEDLPEVAVSRSGDGVQLRSAAGDLRVVVEGDDLAVRD